MTIDEAIDAIVRARSKAEVSRAFAAFCDVPDFHSAYFERLREAFASDFALATRLASSYRRLSTHAASSPGALRVRAVHERLQGEWIKSARASVKAGQLAKAPEDQARFAIGAVDAYGRAGRLSQALALANRLAASLDALSLTTEAARVFINAGNAATWVDDHEAAMKAYEQARRRLDAQAHPFEWASAAVGESTARLYRGDAGEAEQLAREAATLFDQEEAPPLALKARLNMAHALLRTGRADAAINLLLELRENGFAHPDDQLRIEEFLGDAYLRLNLWTEAIDALTSALQLPAAKVSALNRANAHLGLAQAYAALGRVNDAQSAFAQARAGYRRQRNPVWAAITVVREARCIPETVDSRALDRAIRVLSERKALPFVAEGYLAKALKPNASLRAIRAAERAVHRAGLVDREWEIHWARAQVSFGRDRIRHYRAMAEAMAVARVLATTKSSRAAFFRDKAEAMGRYVWELIELGSPADLDEALRALARFRSASLIDELFSAESDAVPPGLESRLSALRAELINTVSDGPSGNERLAQLPANLGSMQRRWNEVARDVFDRVQEDTATPDASTLVFSLADQGVAAFIDGQALRSELSLSELERKLRWVMFEMLAPRLDPRADRGALDAMLAELRHQLLGSISKPEAIRSIAPDGVLWQVPWAALWESEVPMLCATLGQKRSSPRKSVEGTVVWYHATPELPHIEQEVAAILSARPDAVLIRSAREVREWMADGEASSLHVACHASAHPSNPQFSALWFEDGPLFASEIGRARFRVDDVVLSACDTGAMGTAFEIDGLTRSFLGRGARTVVASQWPLHDETASITMKCLYDELNRGCTLTNALQSARNHVRAHFPHPFYWAALNAYKGLME